MLKYLFPVSAFGVTLTVSIVLHILLLSVHFVYPPTIQPHDSRLEVILVNAQSASKKVPRDAQVLAQITLDGGGNTDQKRRLSSPLPPTLSQHSGEFADRRLRQQVKELEAKQQAILAASHANEKKLQRAEKRDKTDSPQTESSDSVDLIESYRAMARDMAIDQRIDDYNKRPRKSFVGLRTQGFAAAQYIEAWRAKVERIGTLNYPSAARGRIYGAVILTVVIDKNGALVGNPEIDKSSGQPALDEAAVRIVQMGSPYAALPPAVLKEIGNQLVITRKIIFTNQDRVRSQ
ncbi:MAG: TonB family protein [Zoogloeaceae bacterium]|jgi:protein TonB|nr:TonB family protein [Zoogloeaceae bacterium]